MTETKTTQNGSDSQNARTCSRCGSQFGAINPTTQHVHPDRRCTLAEWRTAVPAVRTVAPENRAADGKQFDPVKAVLKQLRRFIQDDAQCIYFSALADSNAPSDDSTTFSDLVIEAWHYHVKRQAAFDAALRSRDRIIDEWTPPARAGGAESNERVSRLAAFELLKTVQGERDRARDAIVKLLEFVPEQVVMIKNGSFVQRSTERNKAINEARAAAKGGAA